MGVCTCLRLEDVGTKGSWWGAFPVYGFPFQELVYRATRKGLRKRQ